MGHVFMQENVFIELCAVSLSLYINEILLDKKDYFSLSCVILHY